MTTERDIRNQIRYAERKGREEGRELQNLDNAKSLKRLGVAVETIAQALGATTGRSGSAIGRKSMN